MRSRSNNTFHLSLGPEYEQLASKELIGKIVGVVVDLPGCYVLFSIAIMSYIIVHTL